MEIEVSLNIGKETRIPEHMALIVTLSIFFFFNAQRTSFKRTNRQGIPCLFQEENLNSNTIRLILTKCTEITRNYHDHFHIDFVE